MSDIVDEAREALKGITPGPWDCFGDGSHEVYCTVVFEDDYEPPDVTYGSERLTDAWFIARAPDLVARLADEVERLRAERDQFKAAEVVAAVTPCTCSAQRARAEVAEAELDWLADLTAVRIASRLEAAWDDGNAFGLDGWVGPERGTDPDGYAVEHRQRKVDGLVDELLVDSRRMVRASDNLDALDDGDQQ